MTAWKQYPRHHHVHESAQQGPAQGCWAADGPTAAVIPCRSGSAAAGCGGLANQGPSRLVTPSLLPNALLHSILCSPAAQPSARDLRAAQHSRRDQRRPLYCCEHAPGVGTGGLSAMGGCLSKVGRLASRAGLPPPGALSPTFSSPSPSLCRRRRQPGRAASRRRRRQRPPQPTRRAARARLAQRCCRHRTRRSASRPCTRSA